MLSPHHFFVKVDTSERRASRSVKHEGEGAQEFCSRLPRRVPGWTFELTASLGRVTATRAGGNPDDFGRVVGKPEVIQMGPERIGTGKSACGT